MKLSREPNVEGSDYINASFIDVSHAFSMYHAVVSHTTMPLLQGYHNRKQAYIASQGEILLDTLLHYLYECSISCGMFLSGPKEQTVCKFWQMVWEQQLPAMVMLTRCVEDSRVSTLNAFSSHENITLYVHNTEFENAVLIWNVIHTPQYNLYCRKNVRSTGQTNCTPLSQKVPSL